MGSGPLKQRPGGAGKDAGKVTTLKEKQRNRSQGHHDQSTTGGVGVGQSLVG